MEDDTVHMEELEAELFGDDDEASASPPHTGPIPSSTSSSAGASASASANASASARYHTIVPLQIQPPPSSHGRGTPESTRRPPFPRGSHKLDISRGRGKGPASR